MSEDNNNVIPFPPSLQGMLSALVGTVPKPTDPEQALWDDIVRMHCSHATYPMHGSPMEAAAGAPLRGVHSAPSTLPKPVDVVERAIAAANRIIEARRTTFGSK